MARIVLSSAELAEHAAQNGENDALFELGVMYSAGREVETDLITAHKWFNLAAMRGNREARDYRMEIAREMSKAEIAAAQKSAREWMRHH